MQRTLYTPAKFSTMGKRLDRVFYPGRGDCSVHQEADHGVASRVASREWPIESGILIVAREASREWHLESDL